MIPACLEPLVKRVEWRCHVCEHPVSAMTGDSVKAAMDDHAAYVNRTADRRTDPHFHDLRLTQLMQA